MAITVVKEEATILDHLVKEKVEIILAILVKEEEKVTITNKEPISAASIVESTDTKL